MSEAFGRAMDEISRVWEASDHFDTKILQFIGIAAAGSLAATAIVANRLPGIAGLGPPALISGGIGLAALITFFGLALLSSVGRGFAGPIDPRELRRHPFYLADDDLFERDALEAVAQAFDLSLQGQERKWRLFSWSLGALGVSVLAFAIAATICVVQALTTGG